MDKASDSTPRIEPLPSQRGQMLAVDSPKEGRRRCLDISRRPNLEMRLS